MLLRGNKETFLIFWVLFSVEIHSVAPMTHSFEVTNSAAELARARRFPGGGGGRSGGGGGRSGGGGGRSGGGEGGKSGGGGLSPGQAAGAAGLAGGVAGGIVGGAISNGGGRNGKNTPAQPAPALAPGSVHIPKKSTKAPPPTITQNDPKDDDINAPHNYHGSKVYVKNPCRKYNENSYSRPNSKRKNGCKKAAKRFMKKEKEFPSTRCPHPGEGRCFAYEKMSGRCALLINTNDPSKMRYEFIFNCAEKA